MAGQPVFFDGDERLKALSAAGDPLERLQGVIVFEAFRCDLEAALSRSDRAKGGRPPYDAVLMFKVLVLQTLYALSDEQTEYQLKDRLSFMRFVGLALHDPVPDAKTIWLYREQLARAGAAERLFARFDSLLRGEGLAGDGWADHRRHGNRSATAAADPDRETTIRGGGTGNPRGGPRSTTTAAGRSSEAVSVRRFWVGATSASWRSQCRCSATRTTSASTVSTAATALHGNQCVRL